MKSVYRVLWLSSYISNGCEEPLSFYHGTKNVGYNFLLYMGLYGGFMEGIVRCGSGKEKCWKFECIHHFGPE